MTVIGIEEKRGSFMGQSQDNHLYIPLMTFGRLFGRRQSLQLHGKSGSVETLPSTIEEARMVMRNRHKLIGEEDDTFGVVNTGDLTGQIDQFTGAIALVVTPITLAVAGRRRHRRDEHHARLRDGADIRDRGA